ncbi:MAG: hypothetical protein ABIE70_12140 [bacterium]
MDNNSMLSGQRSRRILLAIPILIVLLPIAFSVISRVAASGVENQERFLEKPDPKYKECVRDIEYMRYHHWELLRQIREEVVRYGKRGEVGLSMCRDCHINRDRFCNQCHQAVNLTPDCFGCHYYPESVQQTDRHAGYDDAHDRLQAATSPPASLREGR